MKLILNKSILEIFSELIREQDLGIEIEEGEMFTDHNGDVLIEILLSGESVTEDLISDFLDKSINQYM